MKKKVLVVVAHPDDETIWMGGQFLRHKDDWETTLICLTRKSDNDRSPKFFRVCEMLGVKGFIFDLDDENLNENLNQEDIINIIKQFASEEYDAIYTHNKNGEYEHIRHKDIHKAVNHMLDVGELKSNKVFYFSYEKKANDHQGYAIYNSNADILIKLNSQELSMKKRLIMEIYGYGKGGFEELSCGETESFDKKYK